jgi:hypothetical protein
MHERSSVRPRRLAALAALLLSLAPASLAAEPVAPTRYTVSETLALIVPGQVIVTARDGDRAIIEMRGPPTADTPKGLFSRAYYDLKAQTSYTLDLQDPTTPCGLSTFKGDWGDPFTMSAGLVEQAGQYHPTPAGTEAVHAIATIVSQFNTPDGLQRIWVEPKTGLLVKWVITPPNGPPKTMIEVTSLSFTPPTADALKLPAKCK